jgi:hypothetical protein
MSETSEHIQFKFSALKLNQNLQYELSFRAVTTQSTKWVQFLLRVVAVAKSAEVIGRVSHRCLPVLTLAR